MVGVAGMSPKYSATFCLRGGDVDVAGQHQHRVVRAVPAAEPVLDVFQRGGVEVVHRADRAVVVRMADRIQRVAELAPRPGRRAGSRPGASRSGPRRAARRGSSGRSRRAGGPCGRIPSTAPCRARWSARSRSSWCGRCWWCRSGRSRRPARTGSKYSPLWFSEPLNIRCSNRCAKPVRPARFVLAADVVPDVHRDDRRLAVGVHDHAQAVGQGELLVRDVDLRRLRGRGQRQAGREAAAERGGQGKGEQRGARSTDRGKGHGALLCGYGWIRETEWMDWPS